MAVGVYQYLSGAMTTGRLQSSGMLGDPNDMGAIIVMALPFALVPAFEEAAGPLTRIGGLSFAGLAAVVIWLTRSRGTMLAIFAQFLVVRLARGKGKRLGLILTALLLGAGYVGLMHVIPRRSDDMEASQDSRLTFWKTAGNMALHSPALGVGFHQYPENYMYYAVGTIYERGNRTAHSSWFLALGESGVVGFYLFCAFYVSILRLAWQDRVRRPAQLYSIAGYGVAMSFLSHTYSPYYYLLTALILASAGLRAKPPHAA
jgi:O-antigen ligase